jgi:hypothetical protein
MQISETVQLTTKLLMFLGGLKYGGFIFEVHLIQYGFFFTPYLGKVIYGFVDNAFRIVSDVWDSCTVDSTMCRLM